MEFLTAQAISAPVADMTTSSADVSDAALSGPSANVCWRLALAGGELLGWAGSVVAVSSIGSLLVAGLGLQHGLQVNQVVVEDAASNVQQLEDLRVAHRVVHAGPGASCVHDVLGAQDGQLL